MKQKNHSIIVVDDEASMLAVVEAMLVNENFEVHTFEEATQAIEFYRENGADLIISDIRMKPVGGIDLLKQIREINSEAVVVLITAYSNVQDALSAMKIGAYDYLQKPFKMEKFRAIVRRALSMKKILDNQSLTEKKEQRSQQKSEFRGIISQNKVMHGLFGIVKKVAGSKTTILLQGESGTGKELFAHAIHIESGLQDQPFVPINCGALPENLLESELFGYVKGAFTGADRDKEGLFKSANGGTLFLDEITSLSLPLQAKLLRVLQEKEYRPLGGIYTESVYCRIVAATNISLESLVKEGKFREDLYYRLNIIPIEIPPLRERVNDILPLIQFFLKKNFQGRNVTISPPALGFFLEYSWPGNVRELENTVERVATLCSNDSVSVEDLPPNIRKGSRFLNIVPQEEIMPLKNFKVYAEGQYILSVMQKFNNNKVVASKHLCIDITTLNRKLEQFEKLQDT